MCVCFFFIIFKRVPVVSLHTNAVPRVITLMMNRVIMKLAVVRQGYVHQTGKVKIVVFVFHLVVVMLRKNLPELHKESFHTIGYAYRLSRCTRYPCVVLLYYGVDKKAMIRLSQLCRQAETYPAPLPVQYR